MGFFTCIVSTGVLFTDMFLSINETYHFELKVWHVFAGYFSGVALVILPEDKLVALIESVIHKKIK